MRRRRFLALLAAALQEKLDAQKTLRTLESERNRKRKELFESQDQIDLQRDQLIEKLERQMRSRHTFGSIFTIYWKVR